MFPVLKMTFGQFNDYFNLKAYEQDDKQYEATEAKILKHKTELNGFLIQTFEFSNDTLFFFFTFTASKNRHACAMTLFASTGLDRIFFYFGF